MKRKVMTAIHNYSGDSADSRLGKHAIQDCSSKQEAEKGNKQDCTSIWTDLMRAKPQHRLRIIQLRKFVKFFKTKHKLLKHL